MSLVNRVGADGEMEVEAKIPFPNPQSSYPTQQKSILLLAFLHSSQCLMRALSLEIWGERERPKIKGKRKVKNSLRGAPGTGEVHDS